MTVINPSEIIQDVILITPEVFADERGFFVETYRKEWLPGSNEMVQGNRADRQAKSIVGLHYHLFQADYWYVPFGTARVVLHDLRVGSPTDGATLAMDLGALSDGSHNHTGIYIPPGVAHGFAALTDMTITYLVDGYYNPADELGVAWNDPIIDADWGISNPVLSERDQTNPLRENLDKKMIPKFVNRV
ncbi:MAG: dTDP-4-dehydrorhamnose 3,5-epimerase [Actinobacteria bacterium]|nr:dTDP-4-dehydrorhamnose 3,5-epimerase [Actinomycetota bacterium]|tara:strand:- start:973 stop:1539 length:567 start_codon:yes stop_codon:yes gene_type:complete